jgi:hypothetical protein
LGHCPCGHGRGRLRDNRWEIRKKLPPLLAGAGFTQTEGAERLLAWRLDSAL